MVKRVSTRFVPGIESLLSLEASAADTNDKKSFLDFNELRQGEEEGFKLKGKGVKMKLRKIMKKP